MATPRNNEKFKDQAQMRTMVLRSAQQGQKKRLDSERYVEGHAANYETYLLYDDGDYGKVYERFERGCFAETDLSDVILQFDHAGRVYARTTNSTLVVEADKDGLFVAADLDKTEGARALYDDIAAQMITKMSWRFRVGTYHVERTEGSKDITIVHTKIPKVYDVSAVSIPANDATEINARSFGDGVIAAAARSEAELEEKRRRLRAKIKILEV